MENFEEIFDIGEELEEIERFVGWYPFPVASILGSNIYFNKKAAKLLPKRLKWYVTLNYIIGVSAQGDDKNAYKVCKGDSALLTTFPIQMKRDKKVIPGHYKVYKYADGICMKRNERIGEDA